MTSPVLLQKFLMGLQSQISLQVLLKGRPTDFDEAVKTATDVEFALSFDDSARSPAAVCTLQTQSGATMQQLQDTVTKLASKVEALQAQLSANHPTRGTSTRAQA